MRNITYKDRTCEKCSRTYTPGSSNQTWCRECLSKPCLNCGKRMEVRNRSKYEKTKFCSRKCKGAYNSRVHVGKNAFNYVNGNRTKVTAICSQCGSSIQKEQQFIDRYEQTFCNRECQAEYYRQHREERSGENNPRWNRILATCDWCGSEYETWPSTLEKTRFCSKQCRNDWQSEMMKGEGHYNWNGGSAEERSRDWVSREYKKWRSLVFERDQYTCQNCGDNTGGNLRAHHIKPWAKYPEHRHEVCNGITLCEACHILEHKKQDIQSDPPK